MKQFRIHIIEGTSKQDVANQINTFVKNNADLIDSFMGEKDKESHIPYIQSVYNYNGGNETRTYECQLSFYVNAKGATEL